MLPEHITASDESVIGSRAYALAKLAQSGVHTSILAVIPLATVYAFLVDNGLLSATVNTESPLSRLPHKQLSEADYAALASIYDSHISPHEAIELSVSSDHDKNRIEDTIAQSFTVLDIASFADDLVSFWLSFAQHMLREHGSTTPFRHTGAVVVATPKPHSHLSGHALTGMLDRIYVELEDNDRNEPLAFEINTDTAEVIWKETAIDPDASMVFSLSKLMHQVEHLLAHRSVELAWSWDTTTLHVRDIYIFASSGAAERASRTLSYEGLRVSPGAATGRLVLHSRDNAVSTTASILYIEDPDLIDFESLAVAGVVSSGSGMYSPLAIACRELGIPCMLSVDPAIARQAGQMVHISDRSPLVSVGARSTDSVNTTPEVDVDTPLYVFARSWDQAQALASRAYDGLVLESAALFHSHRVTTHDAPERLTYYWQQSIERVLELHGKRPVYYHVYDRDGETIEPMTLSDELGSILRASEGSVSGHLRLVVGPIRDTPDIRHYLHTLSRFELSNVPLYVTVTLPGYLLHPDALLIEEVDGVVLDCNALHQALYGSPFGPASEQFMTLLKQFTEVADRYGKHILLDLPLAAVSNNDFDWTASSANVAIAMTAHEAEQLSRASSKAALTN